MYNFISFLHEIFHIFHSQNFVCVTHKGYNTNWKPVFGKITQKNDYCNELRRWVLIVVLRYGVLQYSSPWTVLNATSNVDRSQEPVIRVGRNSKMCRQSSFVVTFLHLIVNHNIVLHLIVTWQLYIKTIVWF